MSFGGDVMETIELSRPCPFCNSRGEIIEVKKSFKVHGKSTAKNSNFVREILSPSGRRVCNEYEQLFYQTRCSNPSCICRYGKLSSSIKDAIKVWEDRHE